MLAASPDVSDFPLQRFNVLLGAENVVAHLGDPRLVLGVILLVALAFRLAAVELAAQLGQAALLAAQLVGEDAAAVVVARLLLGVVDPRPNPDPRIRF